MPGYVSLADSTVDPPVPYGSLNPMPMGLTGTYISGSYSTQTTGTSGGLNTDQYRNLRAAPVLTQGAGADGQSNGSIGLFPGAASGGSGQSLFAAIYPHVYNGLGWDRQKKPSQYSRIASSAASGAPTVAKASAGDVTMFFGLNTQAATRYLHIYNKATAPVLGTDTPVLSFPIAASAPFTLSIPNGGGYFNTGISYAFTTDIATIPTTGAAAADITSFTMLVA